MSLSHKHILKTCVNGLWNEYYLLLCLGPPAVPNLHSSPHSDLNNSWTLHMISFTHLHGDRLLPMLCQRWRCLLEQASFWNIGYLVALGLQLTMGSRKWWYLYFLLGFIATFFAAFYILSESGSPKLSISTHQPTYQPDSPLGLPIFDISLTYFLKELKISRSSVWFCTPSLPCHIKSISMPLLFYFHIIEY